MLRRVGKGWPVGRLLGQLGTDPVRPACWAGATGDRAGAAGKCPNPSILIAAALATEYQRNNTSPKGEKEHATITAGYSGTT